MTQMFDLDEYFKVVIMNILKEWKTNMFKLLVKTS